MSAFCEVCGRPTCWAASAINGPYCECKPYQTVTTSPTAPQPATDYKGRCMKCGKQLGTSATCECQAIKSVCTPPQPATAATPRRAAQPRRMYGKPDTALTGCARLCLYATKLTTDADAYLVIPLDAASVEAMVEKFARHLYGDKEGWQHAGKDAQETAKEWCAGELAHLDITAPRTKGRKT